MNPWKPFGGACDGDGSVCAEGVMPDPSMLIVRSLDPNAQGSKQARSTRFERVVDNVGSGGSDYR